MLTDKIYALAFAYERRPYVSLKTKIDWDPKSGIVGYNRVNGILNASLFRTKKEAENAMRDLRKLGENLCKMQIVCIHTYDCTWY